MEKTKLELLTICDYATISQDNKLSILGMFEQVMVNTLPSQHPQMFIVGIVSGTAGDTFDATLEIKNPSGADAIPPQTLKITLGQNGKSNIIAGINNLPITDAGFYSIVLSDKTGILGKKEFGVFTTNETILKPKSPAKYTN